MQIMHVCLCPHFGSFIKLHANCRLITRLQQETYKPDHSAEAQLIEITGILLNSLAAACRLDAQVRQEYASAKHELLGFLFSQISARPFAGDILCRLIWYLAWHIPDQGALLYRL